jgi:hypothetical protein
LEIVDSDSERAKRFKFELTNIYYEGNKCLTVEQQRSRYVINHE